MTKLEQELASEAKAREEWAEALTSGKYEQTINGMMDEEDKFCSPSSDC